MHIEMVFPIKFGLIVTLLSEFNRRKQPMWATFPLILVMHIPL